jgi:hypothetical protein
MRCDACGTKALTAASKCPKCGHAFEVRDGFGELLPLAHCTSCDSYYPEHLGGCRWCGTKPERSAIGPLGPYVWKGVGILTFASLAIGAWLAKNDTPPKQTAPARTFVADTLPTNQPKAESFGRKVVLAQPDSTTAPSDSTAIAATADSVRDTAIAIAAVDSTQPQSTPVVAAEPVSLQSAGTVAPTDSAPAVDRSSADPPPPPVVASRSVVPARAPERTLDRRPIERTPAKTPPRVTARTSDRAVPRTTPRSVPRSTARATVTPPARTVAKAPARATPKPTARSSTGSRWVTSVARNWAVVRSSPTRQSRIIAAIGPNTRVQLGETRGEWRRIKAKGLAGWVEHRRLVARTVLPKGTGRLAARN